ncbi:proliferating cell nuclear antigen like protein [Babesia gibsoni]|uniref:DNA sliding clamp PCNA n=1 Tax=Babesia gibsoni TaxID=33632 RepID=A0AAD8LRM5_BABGI|nr:proliferating cell nuclear antigen like protein [Babesia gibsoni]
MLELKLTHAAVLRRIFDGLREVVSDANIDIDATGLSLQALDPNHVALVNMKLHESGFSLFRCDRPRAIGIHLGTITKAFKSCNSNDSVVIQCEDDREIITFVFENIVEDRTMSFAVKLMETNQESISLPDTIDGHDAEIILGARELSNVFKHMREFSDTVKIEVSVNSVSFSTEGDVGRGEIVLKNRAPTSESDCGVSVKVRRNIKQSYATKYLQMFAKSGSTNGVAVVRLGRNLPIEIMFYVRDNPSDSDVPDAPMLGELRFFLAPKVNDESEEMKED